LTLKYDVNVGTSDAIRACPTLTRDPRAPRRSGPILNAPLP
jgi:hypothetical protein